VEEKKMRFIKFLCNLLFIFYFLLSGCSIKAPEVRVTGEKLALEREVVGTYQQIEEDTWMIASTRAVDNDTSVILSSEKRKVLEAIQRQKFNKDDIEEFKRKGYVGENKEGFIEIITTDQLDKDPDTKKLVDDIVQEENEDREMIMIRVIELNESLKKVERKDVHAIFARMYQDNSEKGTWIQKKDGSWANK
jgi:uncharacterized protein YdbL (DUF1318 family)